MKNLIKVFSTIAMLLIFMLSSCDDLIPYDSTTNEIDSVDIVDSAFVYSLDSLFDLMALDTIQETVAITDLDSFFLGNLVIYFPELTGGQCNAFTTNCNDDSLRFELVEYYKRSEFIRANISTLNFEQDSLLVASGGFHLKIFDANNNELFLQPNSGVIAIMPNQTDNFGYENDMLGFKGFEKIYNTQNHWTWKNQPTMEINYLDDYNDFEFINILSRYNLNAAPIYLNEGEITPKVFVEDIQSFSNTKVFFVVKDYNVIYQLSHFDGLNYVSTVALPQNTLGHYVVISTENQVFKYSIIEATPTNTIQNISLHLSSVEDFIIDLENIN